MSHDDGPVPLEPRSAPPSTPAGAADGGAAGDALTARSFTAWPAWADLSLEAVHYGPDIAPETELRLLGNLDGKRVLELGCGGGATAAVMAKQGAKVIAVDESAEQLAHARRLCEREEVKVELHQGDLAELAFVRADSIDVVVSVYALGGVEDLNRVFRQAHRVLKPEAPLLFSVPHPAFSIIDPTSEPPVLRRHYFDRTPRDGDYPRTVSDLFTSLNRTNFRVDTLLEPEPPVSALRTRHWTEAMHWVPATLVIRARKQGI